MRPSPYPWFFIVLMLMVSGAGHAESQNHADIIETARSFIEQSMSQYQGDMHVSVNSPDRRLTLSACPNSLHAFSANRKVEPGAVTVGVRCSGERPWTLYVSAHIQLFMDVATATVGLTRGQILSKQMIVMKRMDVSTLRTGYITDPAPHFGKTVKRPIRTGHVINQIMLAEQELVQRGDQVDIQAESAGFQISMKGIALDSGTEGARIQVRNIQSQRVIDAQVVEKGLVRVRL